MDYDHIKIKISCEMKNGYVWEIRTRIFFYIALCIALVFMKAREQCILKEAL